MGVMALDLTIFQLEILSVDNAKAAKNAKHAKVFNLGMKNGKAFQDLMSVFGTGSSLGHIKPAAE